MSSLKLTKDNMARARIGGIIFSNLHTKALYFYIQLVKFMIPVESVVPGSVVPFVPIIPPYPLPFRADWALLCKI